MIERLTAAVLLLYCCFTAATALVFGELYSESNLTGQKSKHERRKNNKHCLKNNKHWCLDQANLSRLLLRRPNCPGEITIIIFNRPPLSPLFLLRRRAWCGGEEDDGSVGSLPERRVEAISGEVISGELTVALAARTMHALKSGCQRPLSL